MRIPGLSELADGPGFRAQATEPKMPFAYYDKLSPWRKKIYRRSDGIATLGIPPGQDHGTAVLRIESALCADDRAAVQRECQELLDALVAGYHVPKLRVRVLAKRPVDGYGELHGLYEPEEDRSAPRITVWMRTAQRQQVVAFKTDERASGERR